METETLVYDLADEKRWRERDPSIVPAELLAHGGDGIANSFHFGEHLVAEHLRAQGWTVYAENYDVISRRPRKYAANNNEIRALVGADRFERIRRAVRSQLDAGVSLEQTDILAIRDGEILFAEAKKGHDRLRPPQIAFLTLMESLGCRAVEFLLVPRDNT